MQYAPYPTLYPDIRSDIRNIILITKEEENTSTVNIVNTLCSERAYTRVTVTVHIIDWILNS